MSLFLAIAGNMGVGKSTLTQRLAETLGATPYLEPAVENPYLADFYLDMKQWAFHSQLYFLGRRLADHATLQKADGVVIQDRSLYENADIFARHLFETEIISPRDWDVYQEIYQSAVQLLRAPDLVIYLQASVPALVQRIQTRGRSFEQTLDVGYLERLNKLYDHWAQTFTLAPMLIIPTEELRYLDDAGGYQHLVNLIKERVGGLPVPLLT